MYPVLISIGSIHLFSLSVSIIAAWLVFSFLFWRSLRANGVDDDRIFNLTFYITSLTFVFARLWYVVLYPEPFRDNLLKILVLWVQPGLAFHAGMVAGLLAALFVAKRVKVRVGYVLDALAVSLPLPFIVGKIGSLLDGNEMGVASHVPWSILYVGDPVRRHPIQLYEIIAVVVLILILSFLDKRSRVRRWPYGIVGVWFFFLYALFMFVLEFAKATRVYWVGLSANQWIYIAFFAESVGALYVRGGGREIIRPKYTGFMNRVREKAGGIYATISKRITSGSK